MPIHYAEGFFEGAHARLTANELQATHGTMEAYRRDPSHPSLSLHRVGGVDPNMWSIRVNQDLRIILHKDGEITHFMHVDHHDAAYDWAKRRRFGPHEVTNAAQLVIIDERIEVRNVPRYEAAVEPGPFFHLDDNRLLAYGVPREWLPRVRAAASVDEYLGFGDDLPEGPREYLSAIAFGTTPATPPRTENPLDHPDTLREFVRIDDEAALARAMASWEAWTLFLHPSQRSAVEADHAGPARVTGGPGTGKSVVAVHRAAHLARTTGGRVLLTSFSRTLAERLALDLDRLLAGEPDVRARVTVTNLHQIAAESYRRLVDRNRKPVGDRDVAPLLDDAATRHPEVDASRSFLDLEWSMVVDPQHVRTEADYLAVDRQARGTPLSPSRRRAIWPIFEDVLRALDEREAITWSGLCWLIADALDRGTIERPFDHAVADEVQDFGPAELWLLRALVAEGRNDVFLAGDANQRIFKPRTGFARSGLEVRGRSTVLRLNYRTTAQIRAFAERVHAGGPRDEDTMTLSMRTGRNPEVRLLTSVSDEIQSVARWVLKLVSNGVRPGEIAILARTGELIKNRGRQIAAKTRYACHELKDDVDPPPNRLVLGTLHRAKGLQFRAVAIIGVEDGELPPASVLERQPDEAARDALVELERNLLYVGCTRARDHLLVTGARRPSPIMQGVGRP